MNPTALSSTITIDSVPGEVNFEMSTRMEESGDGPKKQVAVIRVSSRDFTLVQLMQFARDTTARRKATATGYDFCDTSIAYKFNMVYNEGSYVPTFDAVRCMSHRSLGSVFLSSRVYDKLMNLINQFENEKEWYARTGQNRSLGVLIHGPPGTGKSSTVAALAFYMKRHMFTLDLNKIAYSEQLYSIFNKGNVFVKNLNITCTVPVESRMLVLEECDCIPQLLSREHGLDKGPAEGQFTTKNFLEVLDGSLSDCPGRVLVMTTNHPERIDAAVKRPGRMDLTIEFGAMEAGTLANMINTYCDKNRTADITAADLESVDGKLLPAEAANALLCASRDHSKSLAAILEAVANKAAVEAKEQAAREAAILAAEAKAARAKVAEETARNEERARVEAAENERKEGVARIEAAAAAAAAEEEEAKSKSPKRSGKAEGGANKRRRGAPAGHI